MCLRRWSSAGPACRMWHSEDGNTQLPGPHSEPLLWLLGALPATALAPQLCPSPHSCSGVSRAASHILSSTTFLCSTRQELFPTPCKTFHPLSGHFLPSCHQFPSDFSPCAGSYIIPDEIPPRICAAALQGACPGRQLPQNAFPVYRRLCCEHESPLELLRSPAGLF